MSQALDLTDVLQFVRSRLPAAMVPGRVASVCEVPRTASGRLDRGAGAGLAAIWSSPVASGGPLDSTEHLVCDLFAEVLGVPVEDRDVDFFAVGGHSLSGLQFIRRLGELLNEHCPIKWIFEDRTPQAIAERVRAECGEAFRALAVLPEEA